MFGIIAQLGEHLPYKQRVIGSSPIGPTFKFNNYAVVAQLAEQLICNQQVTGSSPVDGFHSGLVYGYEVLIIACLNDIWLDSRVAKGGRL